MLGNQNKMDTLNASVLQSEVAGALDFFRYLLKNGGVDSIHFTGLIETDNLDNDRVVNALCEDVLSAVNFALSQVDVLDSVELCYKLDSLEVARIHLAVKLLTNLSENIVLLDDMDLDLRFSQVRAVRDLRDFLFNLGVDGELRGYFKQPPGSGKTVLFGLLAKLLDVPTVIYVHSTTLLEQVKNELINKLGFSADEIGLIGKNKTEYGRKITIITYASHRSRVDSLEYARLMDEAQVVLYDEIHKGLGQRTQAAIDKIRERRIADNRVAFEAGFTGTPDLTKKTVSDYMPLIGAVSWGEMVESGILVPLRVLQVEAEVEEDDISGRAITVEEELRLIEKQDMYRKLLDKYKEVTEQESAEYSLKTCVFCANNKECEKFVELANEYGYRSVIVTSLYNNDIKDVERRLMLPLHDPNHLHFVITVNKLDTGWDFPALDAVMMARATTSPAVILQQVGRALRSHEGFPEDNIDPKRSAVVFEGGWRLSAQRSLLQTVSQPSQEPKYIRELDGSIETRRAKKNKLVRAMTLARSLEKEGEDASKIIMNLDENRSLRYIYQDFGWKLEVDCVDGPKTLVPLRNMDYMRFPGVMRDEFVAGRLNLKPVEGVKWVRQSAVLDLYELTDVIKAFGEDADPRLRTRESLILNVKERLVRVGITNSRELLSLSSKEFRVMMFPSIAGKTTISGIEFMREILNNRNIKYRLDRKHLILLYQKLVDEHGWEVLNVAEIDELYKTEVLAHYREVFAQVGIETSFDLFDVDLTNLDFGIYGKVLSVLGSIFERRIRMMTLDLLMDLNKMLELPEPTEEQLQIIAREKSRVDMISAVERRRWPVRLSEILFEIEKPEYLRILAENGVFDKEDFESLPYSKRHAMKCGRFGGLNSLATRIMGQGVKRGELASLVSLKFGWTDKSEEEKQLALDNRLGQIKPIYRLALSEKGISTREDMEACKVSSFREFTFSLQEKRVWSGVFVSAVLRKEIRGITRENMRELALRLDLPEA